MKLELKHLAPYLPYGLKGNYKVSEVVPSTKYELRNKELRTDNVDFFLSYAKPILKPFSDINIDELRCRFNYPFLKIHECSIDGKLLISINSNQEFSYELYSYLLSQHFDIFGLIEKELAIDINTLPQSSE